MYHKPEKRTKYTNLTNKLTPQYNHANFFYTNISYNYILNRKYY